MKYKKKIIGGFLSFVVAASILTSDSLWASQPGTSDDPLVSKSYVDGKITEVLNRVGSGSAAVNTENIISDVIARLEFLYGDKLKGNSSQSSQPAIDYENTSVGRYVPVSASKGQIILGGEGTEIILRSGTAKGYCTGVNGLVDITAGTEVFHDAEIKQNHMLIVPRNDGRGVRVTGTEAWFIIKGQYELLN